MIGEFSNAVMVYSQGQKPDLSEIKYDWDAKVEIKKYRQLL